MSEETQLNEFWTEEFAPKCIDDMVLTDELKNYFKNLIASRSRFNLLLSGSPGIGKTTLARIIAKELNASVLFIPCAIEGTVSTAQGKLKAFCESLSMEMKPKLVILDELDSASGTQDNSFQKTLRNIISESPDTMFIGTCNYIEKVISPIRSRLSANSNKDVAIKLGFTNRDILFRIKYILDSKNVKYTRSSVFDFVEAVVKNNTDIRQIISILQASCSSGELVVTKGTSSCSNSTFFGELVDKITKSTDMLSLREFYLKSKQNIDDYKEFGGRIINEFLNKGLIRNPDTVLRMSDIMYQMNVVIDPEIQFFALLTLLNKETRNAK